MSTTSSTDARRAARALTLQILYEIDMTDHPPGRVLQDHLPAAGLTDEGERFVHEVTAGVLERREEIDGYIHQIAPEWPVNQMSPVDRNILRIAILELLYRPETPLKVAINEAVELARLFGSESARRFVNGALGTFVSRYIDRE